MNVEAKRGILRNYEDLIFESQLLKQIYHEDYIVDIKEELIQINKANKSLSRYLVVVERAKSTLNDLLFKIDKVYD